MNLDDLSLHDPESFVDAFPYEQFAFLRTQPEIYLHPDPNTGVPFYCLVRHDDVVMASRDSGRFSSYEATSLFREPTMEGELDEQRLIMLNQDPPQHTRLRSIVNKGFTPRMINRLQARIREFAEEIVDKAIAAGECDFVTTVSAELPLEVIAELMGAPLDERDAIFELSNRLIGFDDPQYTSVPEDVRVAAAEMYMVSDTLRIRKLADPQDDVITKLIQAEVDGEGLDELEFNLFFLLLAVAGNETTRNAISLGMQAFIEHPDQWQRVVEDRSLLPTMADEIIRWAHPVVQFRRTAMEDIEIRGQVIPKGSKVIMWYPSANRDETVFDDGNVFDVGRDPNPHVSFGGGGAHFCLGAHLARLEIQIMFDVLAERAPKITATAPAQRLQSNFINGIKSMPVTFV